MILYLYKSLNIKIMIKETFRLFIMRTQIEVYHEGPKPYLDWTPEAKKNLDKVIYEKLGDRKIESYEPYNNFESHIEWKTI